MAKRKTAYVCSDCGSEHPRWQGQCKDCGAWNTLSEIVLSDNKRNGGSGYSGFAGQTKAKVEILEDIDLASLPRFSSGFGELDRVLGGGVVPGAAMLIGGSPGAGKSTLLLQVMCYLAQHHSVLYVTGEESLQQVALRADRLGLPKDKLKLLAETDVDAICHIAMEQKPKVMVIDSIQVMNLPALQSAPGGVSQVRECAAALTRLAKTQHISMFIVGHVTKDGTLAGPKVLEHCIDCSMMLDGESDSRYRTLRGNKNRFGAINELGVFGMTERGLKEVSNPSAIFLNRQVDASPGSIVMSVWEGTRPLLVEIQALLDYSQLSNPRRVAIGLDHNRLSMLLAVIHRHGGIQMNDQDVFVNVVGGVKISETSADLAVSLAMLSSFKNKTLPQYLIAFGEIGLSGEIRPVPNGTERIVEAQKHGFTKAIVPKANKPKDQIKGMEVIGVATLSEALEAL